MEPTVLEQVKSMLTETVTDVMEKKLGDAVSPIVAKEVRVIYDSLQNEKALYGKDKTGLTNDQKVLLVDTVRKAAGYSVSTKANEALITETDSRGGYLVAKEVEAAIMRIAASVGLIMNQAQSWPMGTDEKGIPNYTGAFLEGEFLGVDTPGSVTAITFGEAQLIVKKWQLAFVVGNDLLADANVQLADWLLSMAGEAMANMVDKQGFVGTGAPFVGVMNNPNVATYTLATGKTSFSSFDVVVDTADTIAQLEESILDGAAFYMHRTVWAKLRAQKDTSGNFLLPQAGAVTNSVLSYFPIGGGLRPAGEMGGFPVFTSRHYPTNSASAVSTKFLTFGNLKAMAIGERSGMTVSQFESGSFGGKEIGLADQRALVYKKRVALTVALAAAFVNVRTAAS